MVEIVKIMYRNCQFDYYVIYICLSIFQKIKKWYRYVSLHYISIYTIYLNQFRYFANLNRIFIQIHFQMQSS